MVRSGLTFLLYSTLIFSAYAQLIVIPIPKSNSKSLAAYKNQSAQNNRKKLKSWVPSRTDSVSPPPPDSVILPARPLPFFDDFSVSNSPNYVNDSIWQYGSSVARTLGMGINPPSLGVVSFDGYDSLGVPYDVTDNLDKGYGDQLVSGPLLMGNIPVNQRDSVYLSFFYQWQGNGEPPDPGDLLELDFKNDSSQWVTMGSTTNPGNSSIKSDTFYILIQKVSDVHFFHNAFEFRIRSYGRLSGPWDNWNVDYVYLNAHRAPPPDSVTFPTSVNDTIPVSSPPQDSLTVSFPDRTIYEPLTSIFNTYWSVPVKHFFFDSAATVTLRKPSFMVTNLRLDQTAPLNGQPISYTTHAQIESWKGGVMSSAKVKTLDSAFAVLPAVVERARQRVTLNTIPSPQDFNSSADSVKFTITAGINSGDNILKANGVGDYTLNFSPIDFRVNDTTQTTYTMANYYAYDDGSAEFGAGLNQPGSELAYYFTMITHKPDTIVAVDMYFPDFGDESSQDITLIIRQDSMVNDTIYPGHILYSEIVSLQRSALNNFWRHILNVNTIGVRDTFFLGWQQTSSAVIALGLDKSNDTGTRMYYNTNGYWIQNNPADSDDYIAGSLMIRPVFGKGGIVAGLPPEPVVFEAFPNPNAGSFYLTVKPDLMEIFDLTGRRIGFTQGGTKDQATVEMANSPPGIYILKAFIGGKSFNRKIMVHP